MNTLKFGNGEWYGKKDTILAYNDENSNFKPLPFSFDRDTIATRINKEGLIETVGSGEPRIDYKDDSKGALKLEPSRSNLVTYSEDFSNAAWGVGNIADSINSNAVISPDGTLNADTFVCGTSGYSSVFQSISTLSNQLYTVSVFVKKGNQDNFSIELRGVGSTPNIVFDLENGTIISGTDGEIKKYANGWYRCSLTKLSNSTSSIIIFGRGLSGSIGDSFQIYGAQLEQGSYATSYIPTQGSAVTRVADSCEQTVPDGVIGQTEGTVYADVDFVGVTEPITNQIFFIREQESNNGYLFAGFYQGKLNCGLRIGGLVLFDDYFSGDLSKGRYKIAFAYKSGDTKIYVNGVQTGFKDNSFGVNNFAQILLNGSVGTNQLGDINRNFKIYNTRLTDQELINLTTI